MGSQDDELRLDDELKTLRKIDNLSVQKDGDLVRIQDAVSRLGEFYDNVQIFVSHFDPGKGTISIHTGIGNWHARKGHVRDWLQKADMSDLADSSSPEE